MMKRMFGRSSTRTGTARTTDARTASVRARMVSAIWWSGAVNALDQPANQAGGASIAIPEHAVAVDVEAVRFGIARRQLNPGQNAPVRWIELVAGAGVGIDHPERSVVPRDSVCTRSGAGRWNASDDLAGLRLHQIHSSTRGHRHRVLATGILRSTSRSPASIKSLRPPAGTPIQYLPSTHLRPCPPDGVSVAGF